MESQDKPTLETKAQIHKGKARTKGGKDAPSKEEIKKDKDEACQSLKKQSSKEKAVAKIRNLVQIYQDNSKKYLTQSEEREIANIVQTSPDESTWNKENIAAILKIKYWDLSKNLNLKKAQLSPFYFLPDTIVHSLKAAIELRNYRTKRKIESSVLSDATIPKDPTQIEESLEDEACSLRLLYLLNIKYRAVFLTKNSLLKLEEGLVHPVITVDDIKKQPVKIVNYYVLQKLNLLDSLSVFIEQHKTQVKREFEFAKKVYKYRPEILHLSQLEGQKQLAGETGILKGQQQELSPMKGPIKDDISYSSYSLFSRSASSDFEEEITTMKEHKSSIIIGGGVKTKSPSQRRIDQIDLLIAMAKKKRREVQIAMEEKVNTNIAKQRSDMHSEMKSLEQKIKGLEDERKKEIEAAKAHHEEVWEKEFQPPLPKPYLYGPTEKKTLTIAWEDIETRSARIKEIEQQVQELEQEKSNLEEQNKRDMAFQMLVNLEKFVVCTSCSSQNPPGSEMIYFSKCDHQFCCREPEIKTKRKGTTYLCPDCNTPHDMSEINNINIRIEEEDDFGEDLRMLTEEEGLSEKEAQPK